MVICICGLIGSGKTTYALDHKGKDNIILNYDLIRESLKVDNSSIVTNTINCMIESALINSVGNTWLVRTVPKINETPYIDKYILINTEDKQCRDNLIKDKRLPKDIDEAQFKIKQKIINLDVEFEMINLFKTDEKW